MTPRQEALIREAEHRLGWRTDEIETGAGFLVTIQLAREALSDVIATLSPDSSPAVAAEAGISYRQLDHWVRCGYLRPEGLSGSGHLRAWPDAEAEIARRMGNLVAADIPVAIAAAFARDGWPRAEIAAGIVVEVTE